MNKQQEKILRDLAKSELKNEGTLGGGSKYLNPIRKKKAKEGAKVKSSNSKGPAKQ